MADKVLFSCASVQYRKQAGQLGVTAAKVVFFTEHKQLSISRDIITGCIGSKSASLKAQITTTSKSYVFVFSEAKHRNGFVAAMTSRDKAPPEPKAAVAESRELEPSPDVVIPKFGSTEAQIRALLLARDANLRKAYQEVVEESQLISSAEFWRSREHLLELERHSSQAQQVGLSSAMLASVQPAADGTSTGTIAYVLSSSAIAEILAKHPAVRRAYEDYVPDKLNEQEFWSDCLSILAMMMALSSRPRTKYFQSQYFRRARDHFIGAESEESVLNPIHDIFSRYEDRAEQQRPKKGGLKSGVNLDKMVDLTLNTSDSEEPDADGTLFLSKRERERMNLIKEFNRHSQLVLGSTGAQVQHLQEPKQTEDVEMHELEINIDRRESQAVHLEQADLEAARQYMFEGLDRSFALERTPMRFFPDIVTQLSHQCRTADRKSYSQNGFVIFSVDQPDERISDKILSAVKSRSIKATELLRHFWSCFPLTPESKTRMQRYLQSLSLLDQDIKKLRTRLHAAKYSVFVPMFDLTLKAVQEAAEKAEAVNAKESEAASGVANANKRIRAV